jgi:geranylgeranyl diphosphate synthase type II
MAYPNFFDENHRLIEVALEQLLPAASVAPATIHEAMRYSVFAGGKRIRPMLCLEAARIFISPQAAPKNIAAPTGPTAESAAARTKAAVDAGCAIEFIHTYSLIHDDLPALDNDDLRRGKPTCHKQFNEATAILAGDALLTLAFETLPRMDLDPARCVQVIREVSAAAGTRDGMVGGQVADIEAERKPVTAEMLSYIHRSKTAALIRGSVIAGAICGGGEAEDVERMRRFGDNIGWAFQVVDDILDVEESSAALGKTAGKDQAQQKATYPALFGLEKSREFATELATKALDELSVYGERAARLRELAEFLVLRRA